MPSHIQRVSRHGPFLVAIVAVFAASYRLLLGAASAASPYNIAILTPNYLDNGFIRRGLGGTLLYLMDGRSTLHQLSSALPFQLFGATFLALPMALLLRRQAKAGDQLWPWFALVMAVSPQLFWGWARDPGRGDMLISGMIAWSVIAALNRRFVLAALLLVLGSLAHETAIIYGAPLLLALWLLSWRRGESSVGAGVLAFGAMGFLLVLMALAQAHFGDDLTSVARTVRAGRAVPDYARIYDVATFLTWGGPQSIRPSWCMAFSDDAVPFMIGACFVVLIINCVLLFDRTWTLRLLLAFVAVLPMIFISVVAIDHGRWLMFAVANAWLAVVAVRSMRVEAELPNRRGLSIAAALLAAIAAMGPASVHYPNLILRKVEHRIWPVKHDKWLDDCAPGWRAKLGPAEKLP